MPAVVVLYRFWPETEAAVARLVAAPPAADPASARQTALALNLASLPGPFTLAAGFEVPDGPNAPASGALAVASTLASGRFYRAAGGATWADMRAITPGSGADPFAAVPRRIGLQLLRARGGWDLLAAPDQETWLSLSMTFLRRRLYHQVHFADVWSSPAVNELATLVLATHKADDVEGTSRTYGIPALCPRDWLDDAQAAADGLATPAASESALLADRLWYASVFREPPGALAASLHDILGVDAVEAPA